jgi:hypothetical protein
VAHCSETGERPIENLARRASALVRDETDATGIALASGVVEEALLVAHCVGLSNGRNEDSPACSSLS